MPIDLPVALLIAAVALVVASTVAQRAGAHADRKAGRRAAADPGPGGPFGPLIELADESIVAYAIRSRLGRSTMTLAERRVSRERAAAMARAEEIRRMRSGTPLATGPARLVVAGSPPVHRRPVAPPMRPAAARSTVSVELLAASLGLAVVVGIVVGIWPRETPAGAVLSATATPSEPPLVSPSTTPSTELVEAAPAT